MTDELVDALDTDPALRLYAAALSLGNAVTGLFWLTSQPLATWLRVGAPATCWPFFPQCEATRVLSPGIITAVLVAFVIVSLVTAFGFWDGRNARRWVWILICLSVFKLVVVLQDYRLIMNQHYMLTCMTAAFLWCRDRRRVVMGLVILFYLAAGLLKVASPDWYSGAGLYGRRPLGLNPEWIPAACAYVVMLELVVVWGLLSRSSRWFWSTIAQLYLFHVASFWVVGFFYPLLMFLLLSGLIFFRVVRPPLANRGSRRSWQFAAPFTLGAFIILQLVPRLIPGDEAVTGEGRMFALSMFDAPVRCQSTFTEFSAGSSRVTRGIPVPQFQPRVACDPYVYYAAATAMCRRNETNREFDDLNIRLDTRRSGTAEFSTLVDIEGFCSRGLTYSMWRHNAWISLPK